MEVKTYLKLLDLFYSFLQFITNFIEVGFCNGAAALDDPIYRRFLHECNPALSADQVGQVEDRDQVV